MSLEEVPSGRDVPDDINVIVEIPLHSEPVKYEVDKATRVLFVDRVLTTAMQYPCNYGYIPHTLCGDGDPLDVLIIMPVPLQPGCVIRSRPVGMLRMTDESGEDAKLIAVPHEKVYPRYTRIRDLDDLDRLTLARISHFFEHYKDLEDGKWVRIEGWAGADAARDEIRAAIALHNDSTPT